MKKTVVLLIFFLTATSYGQLEFCNGSKGDPIFFENFGAGTDFGPELPAGTTSYNYVSGFPDDGQYTVYYRTNINGSWHNSPDHTPDVVINGTNGKSLIVNASFTAGEFFRRTVNGLCVNTTFEFTAWAMNVYNASANVCSGSGIPVNITFEIWDATETTLLKSGSTGPIVGTNSPQWLQFGLTFTTLPGQTDIVLKMKNNGAGGCGNDLAIDDIMFRSCGDYAVVSSTLSDNDSYSVCIDNAPATIPLSIEIDNTSPHVFQWQKSMDFFNWTDIPGENAATYNVDTSQSAFYYRVRIAQDSANLSNPFCYYASQPFYVLIVQKPYKPTFVGNKEICVGETIPPLNVIPNSGNNVDWYDAPAGGNLLEADSATFLPTTAGTYYAESYIPGLDCVSADRMPVALIIYPLPVGDDDTVILCANETRNIGTDNFGADYLWQPNGETTRTIDVSTAGIYTVTVTSNTGCSKEVVFTVQQAAAPLIAAINTNQSTVTIQMAEPGNYEYSLDGVNYQTSNIFLNVTGGFHTAIVREMDCILYGEEDFLVILIPSYFTPNGDGYNDVFAIPGFEQMQNAKVSIFDRYGKLITVITQSNPTWDGTFNGKKLPSTDYWYRAVFENGKEVKGHFSLKR